MFLFDDKYSWSWSHLFGIDSNYLTTSEPLLSSLSIFPVPLGRNLPWIRKHQNRDPRDDPWVISDLFIGKYEGSYIGQILWDLVRQELFRTEILFDKLGGQLPPSNVSRSRDILLARHSLANMTPPVDLASVKKVLSWFGNKKIRLFTVRPQN